MQLSELLELKQLPSHIEVSNSDFVRLFWKYKGLLKERERKEAFWSATNENLESAYKKLDEQERELARVNENMQKAFEDLAQEQQKSERLLLNVLPDAIAQRLKSGERHIADHFESVSILFADIVGFTHYSSYTPPKAVVTVLNFIFSRFDKLVEKAGAEKIKTIGDAYMMACGIPTPNENHAMTVAEVALAMRAEVQALRAEKIIDLDMRIGIHCGPVIAGIIGETKFIYDVWGDTVNTASRMESSGVPGQIQVTDPFFQMVNAQYQCSERGKIEVKGKGPISTYFLLDKR